MTPKEAYIHNRAIKLALDNYLKGMGAIRSLLIRESETVDMVYDDTANKDIVSVES